MAHVAHDYGGLYRASQPMHADLEGMAWHTRHTKAVDFSAQRSIHVCLQQISRTVVPMVFRFKSLLDIEFGPINPACGFQWAIRAFG
jgi:hypothetical protein